MSRVASPVLACLAAALVFSSARAGRPDKDSKIWFGEIAGGYSSPQADLGDLVHAADTHSATLEERARVDVVVDWPVVVEPRKPAHAAECLALGADEFRVVEDGVERRVVGVERVRRPLNYVLFIDRSRSMSHSSGVARKKLKNTQAAAARFVDGLVSSAVNETGPGAESFVTIVTFDDDLIMQVAPIAARDGAARSRLAAGIRRRSYGYGTALYDSLVQLVEYLDQMDQRSVVILLSDGMDNFSATPTATVLQRVAAANRLTVFPITIGVRQGSYTDFLHELAQTSGGRLYQLRGGRFEDLDLALTRKFEDIRDRLANEAHVSFVAGRKPAESRVLTQLEIGSRNDHCVVQGFKRHRNTAIDLVARGAGDKQVSRPVEQGYHRIDVELVDVVRDRGPYVAPGKAGAETEFPLLARREVQIVVPPLSGDPADPAAVLAGWLEGLTRSDAEAQAAPAVPDAHWINGRVFLDVRDHLSSIIYDAVESYRVWVLGRLEQDVRQQLFRDLPSDTAPELFETIVRERLADPPTEDLSRVLADWLGDLHALDLAAEIERAWANELLASPDPQETLDRAERGWKALTDWLAPPERVRIVTPLILLYDGTTDHFGFLRVVRPRPRSWEEQSLPGSPLAVHTTRWIFQSLRAAGESFPDPRILSVRYGTPDLERRTWPVMIAIGNGEGAEATLSIVVVEDGASPSCFTIDSADAGAAFARALQRSLVPECAEPPARSSTTPSPWSPAKPKPSPWAVETARSSSVAASACTAR